MDVIDGLVFLLIVIVSGPWGTRGGGNLVQVHLLAINSAYMYIYNGDIQ